MPSGEGGGEGKKQRRGRGRKILPEDRKMGWLVKEGEREGEGDALGEMMETAAMERREMATACERTEGMEAQKEE